MDVDWRLKVFCPAFLQKSGRGPGAEPLGVSLCSMKRRRGSKGEPSPGVPPLRAAPAARSPRDAVAPVVNERRAGMDPRPYRGLEERGEVGGGRTLGSSGTPTPTGPCGTGRVPRDILQDHPTPGREDRGEACRNHSSGTSGTPSPTGRVRLHTSAVIPPGRRRSRRRTE